MKLKRWANLFQNQVVAIVLMLLFIVPMLFASTDARRMDQLTAYGILGVVLFVVWLLRIHDRVTLEKVRAFALSGPNLPILLYLAWGLVSVLFSMDRFYSKVAFMQLAFGAVLYMIVVYQFRRREQVRALLTSILVVGALAVLAALALDRKHEITYLSGTFHDRQLFGAFLMLLLPVIIGVAAGTKNRAWKLSAQFCGIMIAAALLMSTCRSAWLGAVTGLGVFLILTLVFVWKWKGFVRQKHELLVTPILALLVIGVFVVFAQKSGSVVSRFGTLQQNVMQDDSVKDRVNLWAIGTKVIGARPLMGWGIGTYALAQVPFNSNSLPAIIIRQWGPSLSESPHNTYVQIAGEQGLIGLALYLAILALFFYRGLASLPRMDRGLRQFTLIGCLAAMAGQMVDAFANPAWAYPEISTFFWLVLGTGMCAAGLGQEAAEEGSRERTNMPVFGMPRFLYRGMRTALVLCAALWLGVQLLDLNSTRYAYATSPATDGDAASVGNQGGGNQNRPIYADYIQALFPDFVNAGVAPPACFSLNAGAINVNRVAKFQIFAVNDPTEHPQRFYADVTSEVKQGRLTMKLSAGLKGSFYYSTSDNTPQISFTPKANQGGKTGTITFFYAITKPTSVYSCIFNLTIIPSNGFNNFARPAGESATSADTTSQQLFQTPGLTPLPSGSSDKSDSN